MSPAGNVEILRVAGLTKQWDGKTLFADVGFALAAGEVLGLSGPSGCGKTTLLSILAGLDSDYRGTVEWRGNPKLAMVFQSPRLLPWRTAAENVALAADGAGRERALPMLDRLGLGQAADLYPARLSLGMARRVALARALITDPDLLLLDEAFVSLDPVSVDLARAAVLDSVARRGMTILSVSHDRQDLEKMADRLLTL